MENILEAEAQSQDFSFVQNRALGISLIACKILSHLDLPSLKNARLVAKFWRGIVSDYILVKKICRVEFKNEKSSFSTRFEDLWNASADKENFPIKVPSPEFIFTRGDFVEEELEEFLLTFGQQIKNLSLECTRTDSDEEMFCNNYLKILAHLPNLEELKIDEHYMGSEAGRETSIPELPHLRKIILKMEPNGRFNRFIRPVFLRSDFMAYKIIMAAPNLTTVENLRSLDLKSGDDVNKFKILKNFSAYSFQPIDALETFAAFEPKLEVLSLSDMTMFMNKPHLSVDDKKNKKRRPTAIYRILESSSTTLEDFVAAYFFRFPEPRFPTLHNLETLTLCINRSTNMCHYFDQGYLLEHAQDKDLQEKLPNLKTVRLEFGILNVSSKVLLGEEQLHWAEHFPLMEKTWQRHGVRFQNCLGSVENLEMSLRKEMVESANVWSLDLGCGWTEMMGDLFPSVKRIVLKSAFPMDKVIPALFKTWPKTTSFVCDVPLSSGFVLDSVLTGLPWRLCEELDKGKIEMDKIDLNYHHARNPSLHRLKELQTLELRVRELTDVHFFRYHEFPISKASILAAFDRLPNLNVTIHFDHKKEYGPDLQEYLRKIAPRVTLAHLHDDEWDW